MQPILNEKNQVVAYEKEPNANRRELRSRSNGLLAYYDKNTAAPLTPRTASPALGTKPKSSSPGIEGRRAAD